MRLGMLLVAIVCTACRAQPRQLEPASALRPACASGATWDGARCQENTEGEAALARGAAAVAAFKPEEAVRELEAARAASPHQYETLVTIYEQLGIAHAYLGDEPRSREAFDMLLTLSPRHLLSYTLSPKVTFLFERVRKDRTRPPPPAIDVSWPRDLTVSEPVPVNVEVVADPKKQLAKATLQMRRKGSKTYRSIDLTLPASSSYQRVLVPRLGGDSPDVMQLYLRAFDADGNEIHRWGSAERPREIALGYERPVAWYRKWWVWAIAGSAVAATTGVTVYILKREPPATVDGGFGSNR